LLRMFFAVPAARYEAQPVGLSPFEVGHMSDILHIKYLH